MPKLKLSGIADDKPVKLTVELPASVHRELLAYAEILGRDSKTRVEPAKLLPAMIARFMATDRGFAAVKRNDKTANAKGVS